jgi:hypothetical protein
MKIQRATLVTLCTFAFVVAGCVDSARQYTAAPLPTATTETRIESRAREIRRLDPSLTADQARSQASAAIAGEDARAEAEWREKQTASDVQEKLEKDLAKLDKTSE